MANVLEITDENFDKEVLGENQITLVDFWATWCGPCRKLSPMIDEIADEFQGKVKFVKIKADENLQTAQKYSRTYYKKHDNVRCFIDFVFFNHHQSPRILYLLFLSLLLRQ